MPPTPSALLALTALAALAVGGCDRGGPDAGRVATDAAPIAATTTPDDGAAGATQPPASPPATGETAAPGSGGTPAPTSGGTTTPAPTSGGATPAPTTGPSTMLTPGTGSTGTPPVTPTPVPPPPTTAKAVCDPYTGPALASLSPFEGLLHEHSSYSDGDVKSIPADYLRIAKARGFSFVGTSEHSDSYDEGNYISLHASCTETPDGFLTCIGNPSDDKLHKWSATLTQTKVATTKDFLAVRGFEWTSDIYGHINVYFGRNFSNAKTDGGYAVTMATFWDWFTRDPMTPGDGGSPTSPVPFGGGADSLAHFNHPHDKCQGNSVPGGAASALCDWNDYAYIPAAAPRVFGMEVYNDANRQDRYQPYYARALDKGWKLAPLGSEDEHFGQYAVETRPKTVTLATALTEAGFKEAWMARRAYALSPGRHLRATLVADTAQPMGSTLTCPAATAVRVAGTVTEADGRPFNGIARVFGTGNKEVTRQPVTDGTFGFDLPAGAAGKEAWYFVRLDDANGTSAAYLSPVWLKGR